MGLFGRLIPSKTGFGSPAPESGTYQFSSDYFWPHIQAWEQLFSRHLPRPVRLLEIGSYEGRSAVWMIENAFKDVATGALSCVDSWLGGEEHDAAMMQAVEARFDHNIAVAKRRAPPRIKVEKIKRLSHAALVELLAAGCAGSFDFVYIDGSHQAPDVLGDLFLCFLLCRAGGVIACDDYLWARHPDPLHRPKIAIDAFHEVFAEKLQLIEGLSEYQRYFLKTRD